MSAEYSLKLREWKRRGFLRPVQLEVLRRLVLAGSNLSASSMFM